MESLLLGAGHSRTKKLYADCNPFWLGRLVRLDMNPLVEPDVLWDLDHRPLPFESGRFAEIAAYDVLEHIGRQGDWRGWFDEFEEYHRILAPGGVFGIIVPIGIDAVADPGHTRFIHANHFWMLNQAWYAERIARGVATTDYRFYWQHNFEVDYLNAESGHHLAVLLRKADHA